MDSFIIKYEIEYDIPPLKLSQVILSISKHNVMHSLNHWLRPECIVKFSTRVSIVGFNNNSILTPM